MHVSVDYTRNPSQEAFCDSISSSSAISAFDIAWPVLIMILCKWVIWTLFQTFQTFPGPLDHMYCICQPLTSSASLDYIPISCITFITHRYPMYFVASSLVCATTRLPAQLPLLISPLQGFFIPGEHRIMFKSTIHLHPGCSTLANASLAFQLPSIPLGWTDLTVLIHPPTG